MIPRPTALLRPLTLVLALTSTHTALALSKEDATALTNSLTHVQAASYQAVNAYFQFSINPGDKELQLKIEEKSRQLEETIAALPETPGASEIDGEIQTLQAMWEEYNRLLDTNVQDLLEQGYPDLRLVTELNESNLTLVNGAQIAIEGALESSGLTLPAPLIKIRDARNLLLAMMTRYSARSASTVSQVFQGSASEIPLDEQAQLFDGLLKDLNQAFGGNPEAARALDNIGSKWRFIRPSIANYNENNVPFVVDLYSSKIVEQLDVLEGLQ